MLTYPPAQVFRGYPLPHALGEQEVAQILAMMCCTYTGLTANQPLRDYTTTEWSSKENSASTHANHDEPALTSWNVMVVVDAVREVNPSIKWRAVVRKLDQPDFLISDPLSLQILVQCYRLACKDSFPVEVLLFEWKNRAGQISFLKALADAGPQIQVGFTSIVRSDLNIHLTAYTGSALVCGHSSSQYARKSPPSASEACRDNTNKSMLVVSGLC